MSRPLEIVVNGETFTVEVLERARNAVRFRVQQREYVVELREEVVDTSTILQPALVSSSTPTSPLRASVPKSDVSGTVTVLAPMPGVVVDILVQPGQSVVAGQVLLRVEAMKMQNSIFAPVDATVAGINVQAGQEVRDNELLLVLIATA